MDRARTFVSYSHRGNGPEWKAALQVFEQHHLLDVRQDGRIRVSAYWEDKIEQAMDSAAVAAILLTPEALASEFILEREFPRLRARQQHDGLPADATRSASSPPASHSPTSPSADRCGCT